MAIVTSTTYIRHCRSILKDPDRTQSHKNTAAVWKKVCFDDCHIREYSYILGDNPAVSKGAPLQIDWKYHNEDVIDVDIFEHCREPVRRHRKKIVMSPRKRAKILLAAGHTVEEIADMTLVCQNAKKARVESVKNFGNFGDNFTGNLADFMTGTAEVTGRTLKLVGTLDGLSQAGREFVGFSGKIVLGTGKMATDVVVGSGKMATDVVVGSGKMAADVVVGTGKVGIDVVVGTGKLTKHVVVGTGNFVMKGTVGTGKTLLGAARRVTTIFSQGDNLVRGNDLKDQRAHLKHIVPQPSSQTGIMALDPAQNNVSRMKKSQFEQHQQQQQQQQQHDPMSSSEHNPKSNSKNGGTSRSRRRTTADPNQLRKSLSPTRTKSDTAAQPMKKVTSGGNLLVPMHHGHRHEGNDDVIDELAEMEEFMLHLQGLSPDQVKAAMANS